MLAFFLEQSPQPYSVGPVALLVVILAVVAIGLWYRARQDRKGSPSVAAAPAAAARTPGKPVAAPGSFGEIQLQNVDDKTAAMLMAIVADELKAPLNQLRFLSIRQLKEGK